MNFRQDSKKLEPLTLFSQSSLTDIILLLLIFFLLTSSFVTNFSIRVNLPRAEATTTTDPNHLVVTVTDEGTFFVDGNPTQRTNLATAIREAYQNKPESTLVMYGDEVSRYGDIVEVLQIAIRLDIDFSLAVERVSR